MVSREYGFNAFHTAYFHRFEPLVLFSLGGGSVICHEGARPHPHCKIYLVFKMFHYLRVPFSFDTRFSLGCHLPLTVLGQMSHLVRLPHAPEKEGKGLPLLSVVIKPTPNVDIFGASRPLRSPRTYSIGRSCIAGVKVSGPLSVSERHGTCS